MYLIFIEKNYRQYTILMIYVKKIFTLCFLSFLNTRCKLVGKIQLNLSYSNFHWHSCWQVFSPNFYRITKIPVDS